MAETITPVVYGGRTRWAVALALHTAGATITAALFGALLGGVGRILGAPWGRAGLLAVTAVALLYAAGELPAASVLVPQLRRQVPDWWRTYFDPWTTALLYGASLGVGFFTYVAHGTLVAVAFGAAASGRPLIGALVMAPFGLVRGLSVVVGSGVRTEEDGRWLVDRLAGSSGRVRAAANGLVLVGLGAIAVIASAERSGGWGALASAVVAGTFGWAAVSKALMWRRWRRTLTAHRLPVRLDRLAALGVPGAESAVTVLAVLGLRPASAALALALLAIVSVEVIRVRSVAGGRVPCGCFGGRKELDPSVVLGRNAALAAAAALALIGAPDGAVVAWPGPPGQADLVPAGLAAAAILVALLTVWRAAAWIGRGRRG
jgi:methylamine utilization protein MauE